MKICLISEGINNPNWSSCSFFMDGFMSLKNHDVKWYRTSDPNIPNDFDIYIDIEGGHNKIADRAKFRPVVSIILDFFDPKISKSIKIEHMKTADYVLCMSMLDKNLIEELGIKVHGIINWGVYSKVWHKYDVKKERDFAFVGNIKRDVSNHRRSVFNEIMKRGYKIEHRHMNCFLEDNARFISTAKYGLNIPNVGFNNINQRDTEVIGCCLPLLTYDIDYFKHIIPSELAWFYKPDLSNLFNQVEEVKNNYDDAILRANKLNDFFVKHHSYEAIAERIVDIVVNGLRCDMDYYKSLSENIL